jgi:hypothetical protein
MVGNLDVDILSVGNLDVDILSVSHLDVDILTVGHLDVDILTVGNLDADILTVGNFDVDKVTRLTPEKLPPSMINTSRNVCSLCWHWLKATRVCSTVCNSASGM